MESEPLSHVPTLGFDGGRKWASPSSVSLGGGGEGGGGPAASLFGTASVMVMPNIKPETGSPERKLATGSLTWNANAIPGAWTSHLRSTMNAVIADMKSATQVEIHSHVASGRAEISTHAFIHIIYIYIFSILFYLSHIFLYITLFLNIFYIKITYHFLI